MTSYVLRRLGSGVVTLLLFATALFFLANLVLPGDFVTSLGPLTGEAAAARRTELGLDRPLVVQYFDWIGGVVRGDLGDSFEGGSVFGNLVDSMASTMLVLTIGLGIAILVGFTLGRYSGFKGRSFSTSLLTVAAILCLTVFPPALGVFMEKGVISAVRWKGLGELAHLSEAVWAGTNLSLNQVIWRMIVVAIATAVLLWLANRVLWRLAAKRMPAWLVFVLMAVIPIATWTVLGLRGRVFDTLGVFSLLLIAVVILTYGEVLLVARAAMDDVMMEDYVAVARAKGLPDPVVRDRHAARTALLPVLSRLTVAIPYFLTGLVILEIIFAGTQRSGGVAVTGVVRRFVSPPGLGTELFDALSTQDSPMLLGGLLAVGVLTLLVRIVLDVLQALLDPRVGFAEVSHGS